MTEWLGIAFAAVSAASARGVVAGCAKFRGCLSWIQSQSLSFGLPPFSPKLAFLDAASKKLKL